MIPTSNDRPGPEVETVSAAVRKEAEALRRDRERAAKASEREAARAIRDREDAARARQKAARDEEKAARAAERDAARRIAERERSVRDAEKEAAQAERAARKAALDAAVAAQRASRQLAKVRLRAETAGLAPERPDDLPPGLALLWRKAEPGRRGPRPGLTLEGIAAAGIALADAEGLPAVSMARVAESLGVTTMALYRYLAGKDDLLALMLDTAIGDAALSRPHPTPAQPADAAGGPRWRRDLEHWCRGQLDLARLHPWVMRLSTATAAMGPHRLAILESGLVALESTPLSVGERTEVIGRLSLHLLSEGTLVAEIEMQRRAPIAATHDAVESTHPALLDYATLLRLLTDPERHPAITAALEVGAFENESYDADLGVRLMLDGVAALVARAAGRDPGHT